MKASYVLVAALLAAPASALAQDDGVRGRWNVTVTGGAALPAGGEFHEGGRGTVLGLPTSVDAKTNGDIFDPGLGGRAGVGYGVSRNVEVFGDFAWRRSEATELSVGNVASLDLRAAFGDYTSYGMDAGMRYHFTPGAAVAPYVSALAGFRRLDAIRARSACRPPVSRCGTRRSSTTVPSPCSAVISACCSPCRDASAWASKPASGITPICRRSKAWPVRASRT